MSCLPTYNGQRYNSLSEIKELLMSNDKSNINRNITISEDLVDIYYKNEVEIEKNNSQLIEDETSDDEVYDNNVKYTLKAIDILQSDKAKQIFNKGKKANWDLNKILTELQISKDQKQLINESYDKLVFSSKDEKDNNILIEPTPSEIAIDIASNYSYSIEINTAKEKRSNSFSGNYDEGPLDDSYYFESEEDLEEKDTKYYSDLTVPGGTNYTEQEISTPLITPNIKGHAQFATDNGIGWFRSDDKSLNRFDDLPEGYKQKLNLITISKENGKYYQTHETQGKIEISKENALGFVNMLRQDKLSDSKTRRILEVQSDLFQKGRDKEVLNVEQDPYYKEQNQFLQLLNKDSNWVTFFIKSIIQDSIKNGYEKVLFPTGNTASKIEGHTTLEEFKNEKEDRLKQLQNELKYFKETVESTDERWFIQEVGEGEGYYFDTEEEALTFKNNQTYPEEWYNPTQYQNLENSNIRRKSDIENEITQLKQELERVETEGFAALKPIYNFYENTVTNILNKTYGKNNVNQITDEYDNTWNEITLDKKRDTSTIFMKKVDLNKSTETLKEGVSDVFNSSQELSNIGTVEQYSKYLNTIFPDSKVKDIVYHGTMENLVPTDKFKGYVTYFTDNKNYAKTFGFPINRKIVKSIVNVKNPFYSNSELADVPKEIHDTDEFTNPRLIKQNSDNYDSVVGVDAGQKQGKTIVIFNPEQIHILGSIQDIKGFKKFVNGKFNIRNIFKKESNDVFNNDLTIKDIVDDNASPLIEDNIQNKAEVRQVNDVSKRLLPIRGTMFQLKTIIQNAITNLDNGSAFTKDILTKLSKVADLSNAKVVIVPESEMNSIDTVMQYDDSTRTIYISRDRIDQFNDETIISSLLHEITHDLTVEAFKKSDSQRNSHERELVKKVTEFYNNFLQNHHDNSSFDYGVTDVFEFVSEFYSNPDFTNYIKSKNVTQYRNLISKIKDFIRRIITQAKTTEFDKLYDTVFDFIENNRRSKYSGYTAIKGNIYEKRMIEDTKFDKLEDRINHVSDKMQDSIANLVRKVRNSKAFVTEEYRASMYENFLALQGNVEALVETEKLKAIVVYTQSFANITAEINEQIESLKFAKDVDNDDVLNLINNYEDIVNSYDILADIKSLLDKLNTEAIMLKLSESDRETYLQIQSFLKESQNNSDTIKTAVVDIKNRQLVRILRSPEFNTEVETKHRERLYLEFNSLPPSEQIGKTKVEYASEMLATRDKDDYEADLLANAQKLVYDPLVDISSGERMFLDAFNTKGRLVQVALNFIAKYRVKLKDKFRNTEFEMKAVHEALIKAKGNLKPSELYKNIYEYDKNGKLYLKTEYSIRFKDDVETLIESFREEYNNLIDESLRTEFDFRKFATSSSRYLLWIDENTVRVKKDANSYWTFPADKYKNPKVSKEEQDFLDHCKRVNVRNVENFKGKSVLIEKVGNTTNDYHSVPAIRKSDLERSIELDGKGYLKDKWEESTKITVDDEGFASHLTDSKDNVIHKIPISFRGNLEKSTQSLDLATMFRRESLNGIRYSVANSMRYKLNLILDVAGEKKYQEREGGKIIKNLLNVKNPDVTKQGINSNEYARLKSIIETNVYQIFSENGKIGRFDMNKIIGSIHGQLASTTLGFNVTSGIVNLTGGIAQLILEAGGGKIFNSGNLLNAEKELTLDTAEILMDSVRPIKTSMSSQINEMFDVFGGANLVEQESIRNSMMRKYATIETGGYFQSGGEFIMHNVMVRAILMNLKVMNADHKFIDKDGNVTTEDKAASIHDMLYIDKKDGKLKVDSKVVFTKHNLTVPYHSGGHAHINLLVKNKIFDAFGLYDQNFDTELSKLWYGKLAYMFKRFYTTMLMSRFNGISTSYKPTDKLDDDERFYSTAQKEYIEGTYTTLSRFLLTNNSSIQAVLLKYKNYDKLSEYEKSNLRKAALEIIMTSIILPTFGMLLAGLGADDDDDFIWRAIYINRRVQSELAQFRNIFEMQRILTNPIAAQRMLKNYMTFGYQIMTPINVFDYDENGIFGYNDVNDKGQNKLWNSTKKIVPMLSQLDKNFKEKVNQEFDN